MVNKKKILKWAAKTLVVAMLLQPVEVYAWGGDRGSRDGGRDGGGGRNWGYQHYPEHGRYSFWLPAAFTTLMLAGLTYYYCEGVYYSRHPYGYVVVPPPCGAVVREIPPVYVPIVINGATYYTADGIYYQPAGQGYVVVQQPQNIISVQQAPLQVQTNTGTVVEKVIPSTPVDKSDKVFTVNVPNIKGGFTAVTLKKAANGYIGPQGEFYPEFPTVEQLQIMYGKK